ncbi:transmembrane protein, putative [Rhizoctonia solani AG-3 Rhs1AP]|uniref:Transmembrane protein, putative n=2 Tax=Rhizoctonia solani AG-3 TaxID=1086053 RepID=X8J1G7_9AGAM|nr:transmembrane protein, putative [Rhizoctonia solani AG-3 Rhs1AP]KEP53714.1 putative transmembrane protein [Rhizoctonia solani 123E]
MVVLALENKLNRNCLFTCLSWLLWLAACVSTLGFAPKYYRKIQGWQVYDPSNTDKERKAYADHVNSRALGMKSSKRAKQQREWDRLLVPLSVTTATSAGALAIPSPFSSGTHWVATACFTSAFGLSLEGLLLIMYLTVFGAGACAETIGRMASGKAFLKGMAGPVAFVTAFPTAIATYSFLFLLVGLFAMTAAAGKSGNINDHLFGFQIMVLAPLCSTSAIILGTIVGCEIFAWLESRSKSERAKETKAKVAGLETMMPGYHHFDFKTTP